MCSTLARSVFAMPKASNKAGGKLASISFNCAACAAKPGKMEKKNITNTTNESDHVSTDFKREKISCRKMVALIMTAYS